MFPWGSAASHHASHNTKSRLNITATADVSCHSPLTTTHRQWRWCPVSRQTNSIGKVKRRPRSYNPYNQGERTHLQGKFTVGSSLSLPSALLSSWRRPLAGCLLLHFRCLSLFFLLLRFFLLPLLLNRSRSTTRHWSSGSAFWFPPRPALHRSIARFASILSLAPNLLQLLVAAVFS